MGKLALACEVSCELCGWRTGATVFCSEADSFSDILAFLNESTRQHTRQGSTGKLMVEWHPVGLSGD